MNSVNNSSILGVVPLTALSDYIEPFVGPNARASTWVYTVAAIVLSLLALEQYNYRSKKAHLPGDNWTIPIIGKFADSLNPTMEGYLRQWGLGPLSAISVFNIFIVMASSTEVTRKILHSPDYATPCLVASMKKILEPDNWAFLVGKAHADYRRGLNVLFTRRALGMYCQIMDGISRKHIARWLKTAQEDSSPQPIMFTMRDLNMEASLRVFCGPHIPSEATKEVFDNYWHITSALELVNFPLAIPGTKVYRAIQARKVVVKWLSLAAQKSRVSMANGNEPECMLDEWIKDFTSPGYTGRKDFTNRDLALTLLLFLFASQDAMSSGLIYAFQHLADHPEVLAKVREEQERVRAGDYAKPLTFEETENMPYLRAVVKESLRLVPPVIMVPYQTTKPFPINDNYKVPAGTMIIPSFYPSLHDPEIYPEPDSFLPERWLDPKNPANLNPQNYLVFGSGAHKCIGYEYAMSNTSIVLANAAVLTNWEHCITPESNSFKIIATLFPKDDCLMKYSPRTN